MPSSSSSPSPLFGPVPPPLLFFSSSFFSLCTLCLLLSTPKCPPVHHTRASLLTAASIIAPPSAIQPAGCPRPVSPAAPRRLSTSVHCRLLLNTQSSDQNPLHHRRGMFTLHNHHRCRHTSLTQPQTPPNSCAAQSIETIIDPTAQNREPNHAQAADITNSSSAGVDPLRTCSLVPLQRW